MKIAPRLIYFMIALGIIGAGTAIAQNMFGNSSNEPPFTTNQFPVPAKPQDQQGANGTTTPTDFKKMVDSYGQQAQTELGQQFKETVASQPKKTPGGSSSPVIAPPPPPPTPTGPMIPQAQQPTTPAQQPSTVIAPPQTVTPQQQQQTAQPTPQQPAPAAAPPPDIYTGFGAPTQPQQNTTPQSGTQTNPNTSNQPSTGWQIQY